MSESEGPQPARSRSAAVAWTLVVVLALVSGGLGWAWHGARADAQAGERAVAEQTAARDAAAAARTAVVSLTSYAPDTLDEDFSWVRTAGTASFQRSFEATAARARQIITEVGATAKGEVVSVGTDVRDPSHVTVLVFVDQTIGTGAGGTTDQRVDQPRVSLAMVRQGGRWLVDDLQLQQSVG